jgi:gliding motility-associated-like protein
MTDSSAHSSLYTLKVKPTGDCDNDGLVNSAECPSGVNCGDKDQDGVPDYLDADSDNDARLDSEEGIADCNSNGVPDYLDTEPCNTAIIMPTLFSPNNDGKNDVIRPIIPGLKTLSYLRIFNRWGNVVFESRDANKGWDGTLNGKPQPQDTYIWVSSGIDNNGKSVTFKGLFSLIR